MPLLSVKPVVKARGYYERDTALPASQDQSHNFRNSGNACIEDNVDTTFEKVVDEDLQTIAHRKESLKMEMEKDTRKKTLQTPLLKIADYAEGIVNNAFDPTVKPAVLQTNEFDSTVKPAVLQSNEFDSTVKPAVLQNNAFDSTVKPAVLQSNAFDSTVKPAVLQNNEFDSTVKPAVLQSNAFDSAVKLAVLQNNEFDSTVKSAVLQTNAFDSTVKHALLQNHSACTGDEISHQANDISGEFKGLSENGKETDFMYPLGNNLCPSKTGMSVNCNEQTHNSFDLKDNQVADASENDSNSVLCQNNSSDKNLNQEKSKITENGKNYKLQEFEMDISEDEEDTICGIGSFRPKWIQKFATARSYLILYSIIGILQGSYFAYLIGTISTLEKRFAFKSKISGVIMIIDEITPLILGIFVGYFGGRAHRPRMVAFGMFLSTLCCLFSALPFFIYGPVQHLVYSNSTGPEVCDFQQKREECDEDDRPPTLSAVVLLIFGSFLKGFGNLAYYAIGLAYMDDNAEKKNTPVYFGISFALRLLGPTSGFLMSSAFLKIYENPFEDPGFGRDDPRWIGAWWMGFVLQGVLLLIFTFPVMLFPRRLPKQRKALHYETRSFQHESLDQKIKGLLVGLKRLSTNELYVYLTIGTIFSILGGVGHYMMLPKYMENQFRLSASDASLYSGPPGLIALQVSTVIGSIIIWKYRLNARALMGGITICETFGVIMFLLMMIPSCPNISFAGTSSLGKGLELQNECNKDCLCTTNVFTPLCGPDGVSTYFSSCHAGCSYSLPKDKDGLQAFENCSCILGSNGSFITVDKIEKGFCSDESCWTQAMIYIILLPVLDGITSIFRVGHTMMLLRCIDPQDKSFALGAFEAALCLFAFIPYPVIFGALADSACLIWEFSCGSTGNCWVYDMQKFNYLMHGVCAGCCFVAVLCNIRVFSLNHKVRDLYEEEGNIKEEKETEHSEKAGDVVVKCNPKENVDSTIL